MIKLKEEREDLLNARNKKLKILAEAKKRGETVTPDDAGVDYYISCHEEELLSKKEWEESKNIR
ncbi:MAG: hypothetical protein AN483_06855 [Aphanizomenon flos-aquae MDT14a]|uniref:Uncharacterized protein n=1 Tax=Aphanizomenon flos-aquae WA102 TaxID=1710896 RepID=A0A1B7WSG6_APHFL|nr:MAG: hypothetical protein AN483_06855 [Aphanizomenon flos-aquae MDT14a]OBQ39970.1 MAG: hypothetical protein AN484_22805 [Aphanizomenon flos-aquae WA102]